MNKKTTIEPLVCTFCAKKIPFKFPSEILEAIKNNKLVIFAGAGISTESYDVFPYTFYEDIKAELKISRNKKLNFEDLMSLYCKQPNGRVKLFTKIKERLDYIKSFPELYRQATKFHRELSTIFYLKEIITTNWDNYFEEECNAVPIVTNDDFAFWNTPSRKVLKIHGSINNYGSIIATQEDYKKCYKNLREGILGSTLKVMLATKTVLFIGYSFGDNDFNKIFGFIKKEMKDILPHAYLITSSQKFNGSLDPNITIINTDGTYFLSVLKHKLIEADEMVPDTKYERAFMGLLRAQKEHDLLLKRFDFKKSPEVLYCSSYQEGLIHSFERMLAMKPSGEYSDPHHLGHMISSYVSLQKERIKSKRFADAAYIDGYIVGITFFLGNKFKDFPLYYIFGSKTVIFSYSDYLKLSKSASNLHGVAYKKAKEFTNKLAQGVTFIHTPFLL